LLQALYPKSPGPASGRVAKALGGGSRPGGCQSRRGATIYICNHNRDLRFYRSRARCRLLWEVCWADTTVTCLCTGRCPMTGEAEAPTNPWSHVTRPLSFHWAPSDSDRRVPQRVTIRLHALGMMTLQGMQEGLAAGINRWTRQTRRGRFSHRFFLSASPPCPIPPATDCPCIQTKSLDDGPKSGGEHLQAVPNLFLAAWSTRVGRVEVVGQADALMAEHRASRAWSSTIECHA
jgi:hypothetical protein